MALVTVTADFGRADETDPEGWVSIRPWLDAVRDHPPMELVTRAQLRTPLNESGTWSADVIASDDPAWQTDQPVPYFVRWEVSGSYGEHIVEVNGPGPVDLWGLVNLDDPTVVHVPSVGPEGPPGPPGADSVVPGPPGAQGPTGPAGEGIPGPPGETGAQGPAGPQGSTGEGIRILGEVPTVGDLPPTGNDPGDAYIVTADGNLHVWTDDTAPASWLDAGQVVGPQGPVGPQGVQGPQGPVGPAGTGLQGPQGIQGIPGDPGAAGPAGDTGPAGPPGTAYLSAQWNFNQNTVVSPASGTMRMDATTYAAATTLWVHETDRDGLDRSAGLTVAVPGDQIIMQSAQGRALWAITGHADSGAYRTFTVTLVESSGTRPSASSPTTLYFASEGSEASGTTILSGTATPGSGTGAVGDYYLDTDDRVLYGPKNAGIGPDASVHSSQTPTNPAYSMFTYEWGTLITCAVAGSISGLRYYRSASTDILTRPLRLWNVSGGAQLALVTTSGEAGTGWFTVPLSTPVSVTAGQQVVVSFNASGKVGPVNGSGLSAPIVNGDLTATTGVLAFTPNVYPSNADSTDAFTDIVFNAALSAWPVALKSIPPGGTTGQYLKKTSGTDYAVGWVT